MTITYRPKGVCSRLMQVEVEDGIIRKVEVKGGAAATYRAFRGSWWGCRCSRPSNAWRACAAD